MLLLKSPPSLTSISPTPTRRYTETPNFPFCLPAQDVGCLGHLPLGGRRGWEVKTICALLIIQLQIYILFPQRLNYSISTSTKGTGCQIWRPCFSMDCYLSLKTAPANRGAAPSRGSQKGGLLESSFKCRWCWSRKRQVHSWTLNPVLQLISFKGRKRKRKKPTHANQLWRTCTGSHISFNEFKVMDLLLSPFSVQTGLHKAEHPRQWVTANSHDSLLPPKKKFLLDGDTCNESAATLNSSTFHQKVYLKLEELDSTSLMGLFQLGMFNDSITSPEEYLAPWQATVKAPLFFTKHNKCLSRSCTALN